MKRKRQRGHAELDRSTRTYRDALKLDASTLASLQRDCATVYTYVEGSMWLAADAAPRCLLEALAGAIFERHTRGVEIDRATAGAEWWVQCRVPGDDGAGDPIDFHWDVDEHLQDEKRLTVTPQLSTVTYLSDGGAPTCIVNTRAPRRYRVSDVYGPVTSATLSFPRCGKHTVFDGALLHGAVPVQERAEGARITLLVNIWLDHHPTAVSPMIPPLCSLLTQPPTRRSAARAVRHLAAEGTAADAAEDGGEEAPKAAKAAKAARSVGGADEAARLSICAESSGQPPPQNLPRHLPRHPPRHLPRHLPRTPPRHMLVAPFGRTEPSRHQLTLHLPDVADPCWTGCVSGETSGGGVPCDTIVLSYPNQMSAGGTHAAFVGPSEAGGHSSADSDDE
jgi:hypothetical protein